MFYFLLFYFWGICQSNTPWITSSHYYSARGHLYSIKLVSPQAMHLAPWFRATHPHPCEHCMRTKLYFSFLCHKENRSAYNILYALLLSPLLLSQTSPLSHLQPHTLLLILLSRHSNTCFFPFLLCRRRSTDKCPRSLYTRYILEQSHHAMPYKDFRNTS